MSPHLAARPISRRPRPAFPTSPHLNDMVRAPVSTRSTVTALLKANHRTHCGCPVCSVVGHAPTDIIAAANAIRSRGRSKQPQAARSYATSAEIPREYAFEVAASNLRFGEGVTRVSPFRLFMIRCRAFS